MVIAERDEFLSAWLAENVGGGRDEPDRHRHQPALDRHPPAAGGTVVHTRATQKVSDAGRPDRGERS